jgi:nitroimidazol reductase NimA-like FMN-containing flavoprotein (pyridoxamine 5'-phosphate oxidase superfamily)
MRHPKREISDPAELEDVLQSARYLILGINDDPAPYLVPLFYGYEKGTLYIHCARQGLKLDLIRRNPRVGFALAVEPRIKAGETACAFSAESRSIVGRGVAREARDDAERARGLGSLMRHYGWENREYRPDSLARTCILAVDIQEMKGKRIG